MRYLIVPEAFPLYNHSEDKNYQELAPIEQQPPIAERQQGAQPVYQDVPKHTYWSWLKTFILKDVKFNKGHETWERITRITKAFRDVEAGKLVIVDEDDWKLVVEVIKTPSQSLYADGLIAMQFIPYMSLMIKASEKKPTKADRADRAELTEEAESETEAA